MAVTPTSINRTLSPTSGFIFRLRKDYPQFSFRAGKQDHWSAKTNTITYNRKEPLQQLKYGVLHELAHALLGHTAYQSDFELLKLESEAWELAAKLGRKYRINISGEHIQNCLDTYRDWLHARSMCPVCGMNTTQRDASTYHCFNCHSEWTVTTARFVRPYRRGIV